jgi:hypothetical protein|tara:strand:+ start:28 stop:558 length:531 start_codon:yes stop_codon:yes gene_type:complete
MIDYKNGKIYQIVCNDTGEVYVGSTASSLEDRLSNHEKKSKCDGGRLCCSKQIIDRGNYAIEILETYPCESQDELRRKEGEYQKSMKCINTLIAGRTNKEYHQDYKVAIRERKVLYNNKHKVYIKGLAHTRYEKHAVEQCEKQKVKSTCECGCIIRKNGLTRHKRTKRHIDLMANL